MMTEKSDLTPSKHSMLENIGHAVSGLGAYAQHSRRNCIIEGFLGLTALGAALACNFDETRLGLIILVIALVLSVEVLNTALEALLNIVHPAFNPTVKFVKDLAAGAALLAAVAAVALGLLLFWEPLGLPGFFALRFFVLVGLMLCLLSFLLWSLARPEERGH